jgi:hypothetical protein
VDIHSTWHRFGRWRRRRPFWGGLLLLLAGLALFFSANLTLADMKVHFGQEGYLSYLLPVILVLCGTLIWVTPAQRLFYAVIGLVTALYSLIGLNLGGFGVGMLLGIVGGALAIAWTPARPAAVAAGPPDEAAAGPPDEAAAGPPAEEEAPPFPPPGDDGSPTDFLPGFDQHRGTHRKTLVLVLVPLLVTAGWLVTSSAAPAHAEDCPEGLPSRSTASRSTEPTSPAPSGPAPSSPAPASATPSGAVSSSAAARARNKAGAETTAETPAPSPGVEADGTGNPLIDGWNNFVEDVDDLLNGRRAETPSAGATPSGSASPAPKAASSTAARVAPSTAPSAMPSATPSAAPSASPSPSRSSGLPDVPCLGPRVMKQAAPGDLPIVAQQPALLESGSLTMYNSSYDGVVRLPTADGTVKALKFSMRKAVTKPFTLTVPERDGSTTVVRSKKLTIDGDVRFYTSRFKGKLFGLIPVTFTPDAPPPLTLPVLWFTDVKINLNFVGCDTLTADPFDITARA